MAGVDKVQAIPFASCTMKAFSEHFFFSLLRRKKPGREEKKKIREMSKGMLHPRLYLCLIVLWLGVHISL